MRRIVWILALTAVPVATTAAGLPDQDSDGSKQNDEEPLVFTNADLPPPLETGTAPGLTTSLPASPTGAAAPVTSLTSLSSYDKQRDRDGHGEGWWRHRAAELDIEYFLAKEEADRLDHQMKRGKILVNPNIEQQSHDANLKFRDVEAKRDRLQEDLRAAGGLPGWLRRGSQSVPEAILPVPALDPPVPSEDGVTLSWKPIPLAAYYLVEVECLDCCVLAGPCDLRTLDVASPAIRVASDSGGAGRWRVRALDADGFGGEWSGWKRF